MAAARQRHREGEISCITFEAVLDIELVEVFQTTSHVCLPELKREIHCGTDADHASFKIPELCTSPAVTSDLLVEISLDRYRQLR